MAGKILGYEIQPPEQRRKNVKLAAAVLAGSIVAAYFIFSYIAHVEQRGYKQAMATITAVEAECRYVVSNISKRSRFYDHTGFIDCATAEQVARDNDSILGRVERSVLAGVEFTTEAGDKVATQARLFKHIDATVGQKIEILYREKNPEDVKEFSRLSLVGMESIAPAKPKSPERIARDEARKKHYEEMRARKETDPVGLAILIVLLVIGFFVVRRIYRFVRRLVGGGATASRQGGARTPLHVSPKTGTGVRTGSANERVSRIVARAPRQGFGQR